MYAIHFTAKAQKAYRILGVYKQKVNELFDILQLNPYPYHDFDLVKLKGLPGDYRVRIGKLRVKYKLLEKEDVIIVYYIGAREGAYD